VIARCRAHCGRCLRALWWWLRQVSGDAAYDNYLARRRSGASPGPAGDHGHGRGCRAERPLSQKEFYLDALRRRYTGIRRCC